jgi:hypothetical protein
LSSGAKAGIGIGIAVLVIALLAGAFLFWRRRRSRQQDFTNGTPPPNAPPGELPVSEFGGAYAQNGVAEYYAKPNTHAKYGHIAPPAPPPVELESPDVYRELPASQPDMNKSVPPNQ